jgi:FKBP-type peptidyl-prolyl cis-trans isomerase (trigger factor)
VPTVQDPPPRWQGTIRQFFRGSGPHPRAPLPQHQAEGPRRGDRRYNGGPRIEPGPIEEGEGLEYTATFEVYPEIELQGAEGLAVTRPVADIADGDLDAMLENLQRQRAE